MEAPRRTVMRGGTSERKELRIGHAARAIERTKRRRQRIVNAVTSDGSMETFIVHPEQDGPFAASVLSMDVWGIQRE